MSPDAFPAEPAPAAALAQNDNMYRAYLHNLLAIGDGLANALAAQAHHAAQARFIDPAAPACDAPACDAIEAFDRIARAMRRTILLARSLAEPPPTPRHAPQTPARAQTTAITPRSRDPGDAERPERPERIDALDDISGPVPEIIAEIAADLGVPTPWQARPANSLPTATAEPAARPLHYANPQPPTAARLIRPVPTATPPPDG